VHYEHACAEPSCSVRVRGATRVAVSTIGTATRRRPGERECSRAEEEHEGRMARRHAVVLAIGACDQVLTSRGTRAYSHCACRGPAQAEPVQHASSARHATGNMGRNASHSTQHVNRQRAGRYQTHAACNTSLCNASLCDASPCNVQRVQRATCATCDASPCNASPCNVQRETGNAQLTTRRVRAHQCSVQTAACSVPGSMQRITYAVQTCAPQRTAHTVPRQVRQRPAAKPRPHRPVDVCASRATYYFTKCAALHPIARRSNVRRSCYLWGACP
jgi:hypothetical protein